MTVLLTLGNVAFTDFEVPDKINFGGQQILVKKQLVGGTRVIHAMGRNDDDISWSGRFRGFNAESRARELDYLRIQGQELVLSWSSFQYLVAIESFKGDFNQQNEIPYSITCTVIQDLVQPIVVSGDDYDTAISSDVSDVTDLSSEITYQNIVAAIAAVGAATSAVTNYEAEGPSSLLGPQNSIQLALGQINSQTDVLNAQVASSGTIAGMTAGGNPLTLAASLSSQSAAFGQLGILYQSSSLLQRTSINISNAAGGVGTVLN
jgi:hypothetical protein